MPSSNLHPRLLRHLEMGQQISEQLQEPTQGLHAQVVGKTVLPRSGKNTVAELYFIKRERTGTSHTETTELKDGLTASVYLPRK